MDVVVLCCLALSCVQAKKESQPPAPIITSIQLPHQQRTRPQIDYILTGGGTKIDPASGKPQYSYLIGFGVDFPRAPHHRSSSCDGDQCDCSKKPHPHVLYGALVGGPGAKDDYKDDCADYQRNVRSYEVDRIDELKHQ